MTSTTRLERLPLEKFPCQREISLIFADIDTIGHVNNVAISRFFEEARVSLHRMVDNHLAAAVPRRLLLVHIDIDYLAEVFYPGDVQLGIGVTRIGRTSVQHSAALFQNGRCVAVSKSVDVNTVEGQVGPAELDAGHRSALLKCLLPM
ncbi:Predicted thioesterase [Rhodococcus wratislaviensis]|uniref:Predicted thioesterase n=1 Tax=Rhodococcus wratislaviensis TaxID=44752 RepID=A0A402CKW6_RHOWR|nr:acyl-CoA thioesterase [Rhodococcus wratislaviensis]GCE44316.1 Predicted thioesterase [Rhodococcus wratislaviensis]